METQLTPHTLVGGLTSGGEEEFLKAFLKLWRGNISLPLTKKVLVVPALTCQSSGPGNRLQAGVL